MNPLIHVISDMIFGLDYEMISWWYLYDLDRYCWPTCRIHGLAQRHLFIPEITYSFSTDGVEFLDLFVYVMLLNSLSIPNCSPKKWHIWMPLWACDKKYTLWSSGRVRQNNSEDTNFEEQRGVHSGHLKTRL